MSSDADDHALSAYIEHAIATQATHEGLPWERARDAWLASLSSARTRHNYRATIDQIFRTPGVPQSLEAITLDLLVAWRGALVQRAQLAPGMAGRISPATANRHISAARAFFDYWRILGHLPLSADALHTALKRMKAHLERPYQVLDDDELPTFLASAAMSMPPRDSTGATPKWSPAYRGQDQVLYQRDTLLIAFMLATGLRVDEVHQLQVGDLSQRNKQWWIAVRSGKGNASRNVPLAEEDAQALLSYIGSTQRRWHVPADRETPLWLSRRGTRLSTVQIWRIVDATARRAGLETKGKNISPHALRHTYAVRLLRGDGGPRPATIIEVQALLGHASIMTTQGYLKHLHEADLAILAPMMVHLVYAHDERDHEKENDSEKNKA